MQADRIPFRIFLFLLSALLLGPGFAVAGNDTFADDTSSLTATLSGDAAVKTNGDNVTGNRIVDVGAGLPARDASREFQRGQARAYAQMPLLLAANSAYAYDDLNRLTRVDAGDGSVIEYSYDAAGNRTRHLVQAATSTYAVTLAKAGTGAGTVGGGGNFAAGATVTLTATPATGSTFTGWSPSPCAASFTMPASALTCTATFTAAPVTYALTVAKVGTGSGTVTGAGINCGTDCTESYASGASVTLAAMPASDSSFVGWTGACTGTAACTLTMNSAKSVTATFKKLPVVTLTLVRRGIGTVTSQPAGINCGADCKEPYARGTVVALTATPAAGYVFSGWSGACTGKLGCSVTMNTAKRVTATFKKAPTAMLTVVRRGSGTVTSQPAGISCGADCKEPPD